MSRNSFVFVAALIALGAFAIGRFESSPTPTKTTESATPKTVSPGIVVAASSLQAAGNKANATSLSATDAPLANAAKKPESEFDSLTAVPIPKNPGEVFKFASPSVVLVKTYDENNTPLMIGSGFFVGDGTSLVTNAHVIAGASRVEFEDSEDRTHSVSTCLAIDVDGDLALLEATGPALRLFPQKPSVGDHIFVIGNPKGLTRSFSDGLVSSLRSIGSDEVIQITAPISPGSSGGPVLNTEGEVIGVASFYFKDGENLNFAIESSKIAALLKNEIRQPISATLVGGTDAGHNIPQIGRNRVALTNVGTSSPPAWNACSVTLENHEDYSIGAVAIRVFYYRDVATELKEQIGQFENRVRQLESQINPEVPKQLESQIAQEELYMRVLDRDPESWGLNDIPAFPQNSPLLFYAKLNMQYPLYAAQLRTEVPEERVRANNIKEQLQSQLESLKKSLPETQKSINSANSEITRLQEMLGHPAKQKAIDYEDVVLRADIEPGLSRTLDMALSRLRGGWRAELVVNDYEVLKTQGEQFTASGTVSVPGNAPNIYIVKVGDTGAKIAMNLNVTLAQLAAANPTVSWAHLKVGQQLTVPTGP